MVGNEQVAGRFCVQDKYQLVGICGGRYRCFIDRADNSKFPGDQSRDGESREVIANRIMVMRAAGYLCNHLPA